MPKQTKPLATYVLVVGDRTSYYSLAPIESATVVGVSKNTVSLEMGQRRFDKVKNKVYCLPVEISWQTLQSTYQRFQATLDKIKETLLDLGRYDKQLERRHGKVPNPLAPYVILAEDPERDPQYDWENWQIDPIDREGVNGHVNRMLQLKGGGFSVQSSAFLCPTEEDWQYVSTLYRQLQECQQEFLDLWGQVPTYGQLEETDKSMVIQAVAEEDRPEGIEYLCYQQDRFDYMPEGTVLINKLEEKGDLLSVAIGVQSRVRGTDPEKVKEISEIILRGEWNEKLPMRPFVIQEKLADGSLVHWIPDGNKRVQAFVNTGVPLHFLPSEIKEGTFKDAEDYSWLANREHDPQYRAEPRTDEDVESIFFEAFKRYPDWSLRQVGEKVGYKSSETPYKYYHRLLEKLAPAEAEQILRPRDRLKRKEENLTAQKESSSEMPLGDALNDKAIADDSAQSSEKPKKAKLVKPDGIQDGDVVEALERAYYILDNSPIEPGKKGVARSVGTVVPSQFWFVEDGEGGKNGLTLLERFRKVSDEPVNTTSEIVAATSESAVLEAVDKNPPADTEQKLPVMMPAQRGTLQTLAKDLSHEMEESRKRLEQLMRENEELRERLRNLEPRFALLANEEQRKSVYVSTLATIRDTLQQYEKQGITRGEDRRDVQQFIGEVWEYLDKAGILDPLEA